MIPTLCYSQGSTGDCDKSSFSVMGGAVAFGDNINWAPKMVNYAWEGQGQGKL